jgi:hypothetical protein
MGFATFWAIFYPNSSDHPGRYIGSCIFSILAPLIKRTSLDFKIYSYLHVSSIKKLKKAILILVSLL